MTSVLDRIEDLMGLQRQVNDELARRAPGITPYQAKILEWLGRNRTGSIPRISVALGINRETTRWSVNRLIDSRLARYATKPSGPGRPQNVGRTVGEIELTPAGLRLYDKLRG